MKQYILKNRDIELNVLTTGASLYDFKYKGQSLVVKNKKPEDYKVNPDYLGTTVAPLAGRYLIDGEIILHSGEKGLARKEFTLIHADEKQIVLECDFLKVKYNLLAKGFKIEFIAENAEKMLLNITNHSYFCLDKGGSVNTHKALINSKYITLKNEENLAIGVERNSIKELDFSQTKPDDYYYFQDEKELLLQSQLVDFKLKLSTSYDGVVLYTYNNPSNAENRHSAVAIEPQYAPNSFNLFDSYYHYIKYEVEE